MIDNTNSTPSELPDPSHDPNQILAILEDVATRRLAGEHVTNDEVLATYPQLRSQLKEELSALEAAENARELVTNSSTRPFGHLSMDRGHYVPSVDHPSINIFEGYEVHNEIGRGLMGVVYRALQRSTNREVAIKVMMEGPFVGPKDRARFEREARVLAQLRHSNVITIHDTGVASGRLFIVMDYIDGLPLDVYLVKQSISLREEIELFIKICEAIGAAHLCGIIHRDLKPSNILVDQMGEPHVLDFGLAKAHDDDLDLQQTLHDITMTRQFVGSLPWASPEQAEGRPDHIDVRSDVYTLGVILFQMLTGKFPYPIVGHVRDIIENIIHREPIKPSSVARELEDDLETIVLKALSKEPARRYQSTTETRAGSSSLSRRRPD